MKRIVALISIFVFWLGPIVFWWWAVWWAAWWVSSVAERSFEKQMIAKDMWVPRGDKWEDLWESFIVSIEKGIKYILGLLGIITVIYLIYGGIKIVTAAGDDAQVKKSMKMVTQAAIWIVYIWLAWLFVMLVFGIVNYMTEEGSGVEQNRKLET